MMLILAQKRSHMEFNKFQDLSKIVLVVKHIAA